MEVKKGKPMEEQVREKTIPVFTVLKNGAILKNIFVVNSRKSSSPERNETAVGDDDEVEEILVVGRHPECDIVLTHPSISRFHLEIRSIPSRQKLFVTDLSSVHGTWITDQKVERGACVEVKEGDVIRIGGSTRIYRLHWIPLSRAYDIDHPFVPPLDASTVMEQEEENRVIEAENLEITHQILEDRKTASDDDRGLHLDAMSERTISSVPSDEDPYPTTKEIFFPLASSSGLALARDPVKTQKLQFNEDMQTSPKWGVDTVEVAAEKPSDTGKQQSGGYLKDLGWLELELAAEADGRLLQQKVQTSPKWDLDTAEDEENPSSSCSPSIQQSADYLQKLSSVVEVDECNDVKGDGILLLNVMTEATKSSVPSEDEDLYLAAKKSSSPPLPRDSIVTEKLQLQDGQSLTESFIYIAETKKKNSSKEQTDGWFETSGCSAIELGAEAEGEGLYLNDQKSPNSGLDIVAAKAAKKPRSSCSLSKQQSGSYLEDFGCSKLVLAAEANGKVLQRNVMSEGMDSSVLIKVDDPSLQFQRDSIETKKLQFKEEVPTSPKLLIGIIEKKAGNSSSECYTSKGHINSCIEAWDCSALELNAEAENQSIYCKESGDTEFFSKKVIDAEAEIQSFSRVETDFVTKQVEEPTKPLTKVEGSGETESISRKIMDVSLHSLAKTEPLLQRKPSDIKCIVLDLQPLSDIQTNSGEEKSCENLHHEDSGETDISRQVVAVSQHSFPKVEPLLEIVTEDVRDLLGTEFQSEVTMETDNENPYQKINGETKVESREVSAVSDCLFAVNERLSRNNPEDIQSLYYGWQSLSESEVGAPTNQKPKTDMSTDSGISEESYSLSQIEDKANNDKRGSSPSILAAEKSEDTQRIQELPSDSTESQENQTPGSHDVRSSQMRLSTCNVWSRRGKAASILQIRTDKNEGKQKQIGNKQKPQLQIKQTASDKSISLSAHNGAEALEPEIFTPDKENLTPNSHMRKRLQEIGEIKDSKSSSKLSGGSYSSKIPSSIETIPSWALIEPEIFTPDKENLTPSSHMLKRLQEFGEIKELKGSTKSTRKPFSSKVVLSPDIHLKENVMAEQKPDLHSMSRKSKVKKKSERAPFQTLLEKPSAKASSSASARNNITRGCRSSSILSDRKSKMKWTIVLDTSSLLDKESRKPLHLLHGLKGTHLVVPRIVLRELDEMKKHARSLLFRRTPEIVSSALDWIEECMIKTKWWIQLQSQSEETKATALTPPVTPQTTKFSDGSAFPFSLHWNTPEIVSPTSEDQILECALLYRDRNSDEKLVLLSNDVTLKVKAMAEGVICETAQEFYESLVNPFSERFMWAESSPRGRTWNHLDDVVLRERYSNRKKSWCNGGESGAAKGLKLILLHNSHYGQVNNL